MSENLIMITIFTTGILYSLGGVVKKIIRRAGIPILIIGVSLVAGSFSPRVLVAALITGGALTLGYGQSSGWLKRIGYAVAISAPSLIVAFSIWSIILPAVFLFTFWASNTNWGRYIFFWRACEALVGLTLGILWSSVL